MRRQNYSLLVLVLGALTAVSPFSIDAYLPAFPDIAASLGTTTDAVTLSLSSYFLGIATGQILYGPLLDRFGRKPPLYVGLIIYLLATAGCYFTHSIDGLIAFRFVQALGGCAAGVVAMALVRDLFPVKENAKVFSLLMLVVGMSPLLAPSIGSFVTAHFGWRTVFTGLFLLTLLILIAAYRILPEPPRQTSGTAKVNPFLRYLAVFKQQQFLTYSIGGGIAFSGLFAYLSDSASIFIEGYRISNTMYGWLFAAIASGFILASQLNRLLLRWLSSDQIIMRALVSMVLFGTVLFAGLQLHWFTLAGTAVLVFLLLSCIGLINPNAAALSMAPFDTNAGTAASLYGFIQWGIAGIISVIMSLFDGHSAVPLAIAMTGSAVAAIGILTFASSRMAASRVTAS